MSEQAGRMVLGARSIEGAAVAGMVYAVLSSLAFGRLADYPDLGSGDAELTAWFGDSSNQAQLLIALATASVSAIAFLWFIAVIRRRLGRLEDRFVFTVFQGSGIVYVTLWLAGAAAYTAPAVAMAQFDGATATTGGVSFAAGLGGALVLVVAPRLEAVFVFTTSTVILRTGVLPRWVAYGGYAFGIVLFVTPWVTIGSGFVFPTWVFLLSVVLLTTTRKAVAATAG